MTREQYPVLEGAGLALVRVADDVAAACGCMAAGFPFRAGRKARTAATPQVGALDLLEHRQWPERRSHVRFAPGSLVCCHLEPAGRPALQRRRNGLAWREPVPEQWPFAQHAILHLE